MPPRYYRCRAATPSRSRHAEARLLPRLTEIPILTLVTTHTTSPGAVALPCAPTHTPCFSRCRRYGGDAAVIYAGASFDYYIVLFA